MMTSYIVYYEEEAKRNNGFIKMLKEEAKKYDLDMEYCAFEKIKSMSENKFENKFMNAVFVINRTRNHKLSQRFENLGIKVFHSSKITELGNDKYKTYLYLKEYFKGCEPEEHWIAHTVLVKEKDLKKAIDDNIGKDLIIKSVDGHGGSQVFSLKCVTGISCSEENSPEYKDKSSNFKQTIYEKLKGHNCIIQEQIDSDSNDIRVYVLFGKIFAAVIRHGNDDFKSNYSLGGSVSEFFPDEEQKIFINKFIEAFGGKELCMAGIDFILTRDRELIFNELEEMVGSRMLYNCSKHDIVRNYMEQIAENEINAM